MSISLKVDPHLQLVDGSRLQAVFLESDKGKMLYGLEEDEVAALKTLSAIELDDQQLKETMISNFVKRYAKLSEVLIHLLHFFSICKIVGRIFLSL